MNIQIISREGSPSTREIGAFLLAHKEKFMKIANFKIVRVNAQNETRIIQEYNVKNLPFIIANGKKYVGVDVIKSFLIDLLRPASTDESNHEDYLLKTNKFKLVNGKTVFEDDLETESADFGKQELNKKIMEFEKKRKNTKVTYPKSSNEMEYTAEDYKLEEHELDMEEWRAGVFK